MHFVRKALSLCGRQQRPLVLRLMKLVTEAPTRQAAKGVAILGAAALAVGWGLLRWRRRQAWRAGIAKAFSPPAPAPAAAH